jgi:integrase
MPRRATGFVREVKRKRGLTYYAAIKLPDGSQRQPQLGLAWTKRSRPPEGYITRSQAEAMLTEKIAEYEAELGRATVPGATLTLAAAAEDYLRYIEFDRKRRASTVADYRQEIERLYDAFGSSTLLADLTTERIESWRAGAVAEGKLSARTINKRRQILGAIFKRAIRHHGLASNPIEAVERQPEPRSDDFNILSPDQLARLIAAASSEQNAVLYTVASQTGLRLGELRALRWRDVDWVGRFVHVRRSYVHGVEGAPKSGKTRSVPLNDQAAAALDGLSRRDLFTGDDDRVFSNEVGGYLSDDKIRDEFYTALDAAGLGHKREGERPIRFHDLRHTFGSISVRGFPVTDVREYMGHADLQTTQRYAHYTPRLDAAQILTHLFTTSDGDPVGCAPGARPENPEQAETLDPAPLLASEDGPGWIRTTDLRIMSPLL